MKHNAIYHHYIYEYLTKNHQNLLSISNRCLGLNQYEPIRYDEVQPIFTHDYAGMFYDTTFDGSIDNLIEFFESVHCALLDLSKQGAHNSVTFTRHQNFDTENSRYFYHITEKGLIMGQYSPNGYDVNGQPIFLVDDFETDYENSTVFQGELQDYLLRVIATLKDFKQYTDVLI